MKNAVYELKNQRSGLLAEAKAAREAKNKELFDAKMAEVRRLNDEIGAEEALQAEEGRFADGDRRMESLHDAIKGREQADKETERSDAVRGGREYVQAFAYALRNGVTMRAGAKDEKCAPLYAAMKETGGTPEGSDGGFLVPIDIDNSIIELQRAYAPLAPYFAQEMVNTLSGWRVMDTIQHQGFEAVDEMGEIPMTNQPKFRKVEYKLQKYGGILPVSHELMDDNAANLMAYLSRWFARKSTITENGLLLALLKQLTPLPVVEGDEVKAVKTALNVTLDPAISLGALLLTNQDGFNVLDTLEDEMGRPLLQPDPVNRTLHRFLGRPVHVEPNAVLKSAVGAAPLYLGTLSAYATLFKRKAFEVASTDIGGAAWRTDSREIRGLMRRDAQIFDDEAVTALALSM